MLEAQNRKSVGVRTPGHPLLICSSYSQTKPVLLSNNILGLCYSRNKNFDKRISPVNRSSPAYKKQSLKQQLISRQVLLNEIHVFSVHHTHIYAVVQIV